jgi:hypothetical protein
MRGYRLYFKRPDGHFAGVKELACPDNDAAIETARQHADGRAMELWEQARQVKAFPAGKPPLPPPSAPRRR